jgi:hypothetical protein
VPICASCGRESEGGFAFCPYCGAELGSVPPAREQRKTVTVLFCDVTGSTALGESTDPEALHALLADGKPHVVELDGHEWHKSKEQRGADAERERWFEERGIRVHRFTGTQVHADAEGCVSELLNLLRGAASRP